jgi:hypothetical protein
MILRAERHLAAKKKVYGHNYVEPDLAAYILTNSALVTSARFLEYPSSCPKSNILSNRLGSGDILNSLLTSSSGRGGRPCATLVVLSSLLLTTWASARAFSRAICRDKYATLDSSVLYASRVSIKDSMFRVRVEAEVRFREENDDGSVGEEKTEEERDFGGLWVKDLRNALRRTEFRIWMGSSSRIAEKVSRLSMRLKRK